MAHTMVDRQDKQLRSNTWPSDTERNISVGLSWT